MPMNAVSHLGCASHLFSHLQRQASPPVQRRGSPTGDEESTELAYLMAALDAMPAPVANAIGQHVSRVNDGMAKGRAERRGLAKAVHELQQQLMVIPRLEVRDAAAPLLSAAPCWVSVRRRSVPGMDSAEQAAPTPIFSPAHMPHTVPA